VRKYPAWTSLKSCFVLEVDAELALQMSDFSVTPPTPAGNGNNEEIASVEKSGRFVSANFLAYLPGALLTCPNCAKVEVGKAVQWT
jgi:hypothetical protein